MASASACHGSDDPLRREWWLQLGKLESWKWMETETWVFFTWNNSLLFWLVRSWLVSWLVGEFVGMMGGFFCSRCKTWKQIAVKPANTESRSLVTLVPSLPKSDGENLKKRLIWLRLVGWLLGCLVGWLVACLLGWLVACLVACLLGWLVGWLGYSSFPLQGKKIAGGGWCPMRCLT